MLTAVCSCLLLLVILLGPIALLKLKDAWADVTSEDEGRWSTFAERDKWSR